MQGARADRISVRSVLPISGMITASLLTGVFGATAGHGADIELGRYLSSECMTCHGTAKADSTIPNIFGLSQAHFTDVIQAYRAKTLPNPIMQTIAGRLNDEDIAALALYFATARKPE